MIEKRRLENMAKEIQNIQNSAEHIKDLGKGIESVQCYAARILSSIRLLEMNVTDVVKLSL